MSKPMDAQSRREFQTQVIDVRDPAAGGATPAYADPGYAEPPYDPAYAESAYAEYSDPAAEEFYGATPVVPPRGFGGVLGVVTALLATAGVVAGALVAPDVAATQAGDAVRSAFGLDGTRGAPHWWSVALPLVAAAWCWAGAARARHARRFGRWGGWAWMGFVLVLVSAATAMDLPALLRELVFTPAVADQLPAWMADNPVETGLGALLGVGFLVLLAACRAEQKLLLVLAAASAAFGAGLTNGVVSLPVTEHVEAVVAVAAPWLGLTLTMLAAALERRS